MPGETRSLALQPFVAELEEIFTRLSHAELKDRLLRHARQLPSAERRPFLAVFTQRAGAPAAPTEQFLEEIHQWVERLEAGEYYEGYGWDSELGIERAFGDESWAEDADDLFAEADAAFLAGERALACQAYELLLGAFLLEEEEEVFCGPRQPAEMVRTDLRETKARYFRALYETTAAADRADLLLNTMRTLRSVGPHVGLGDLLQADAVPLPTLEEFLPSWLEVLKVEDSPEHGSEGLVRKLLVEAVMLSQGTDGLREMARERGEYLPWVEALEGEGRKSEAIAAALEGLANVHHSRTRRLLSEALARLAIASGDSELLLRARRIEWREWPSAAGLVHLCRAAEAHGNLLAILTEEAGNYRKGTLPLSPGLASRLLLLTGDYHAALELFQNGKELGWSSSDHPGPIVLPFLLLATSKKFLPQVNSALAQLWNTLDGEFRECLLAACNRQPPEDAEADHFLKIARTVIERRVHSIVSNKHRGAYDRAALVTVAYAEATVLRGAAADGLGFVGTVRSAFPRHYAFRDALDSMVRSSRLLRDQA